MQDIFKYIEEHNEEAIAQLIELCSLPTVSAQGQAIGETAEWVSGRLRALGFEVQVIGKPASKGESSSSGAQPVVYAALTSGPSPAGVGEGRDALTPGPSPAGAGEGGSAF